MTQLYPRYIQVAIMLVSLSVSVFYFSPVHASESPGRLKLVFDVTSYDFELQRTHGVSISGGSDINEVLSTAHRIGLNDEDSWYRELS